jgi:hypothetical protein
VFDAPFVAKPFEERIEFLKEFFNSEDGKKAKNVQLVEHEKCQGMSQVTLSLENRHRSSKSKVERGRSNGR